MTARWEVLEGMAKRYGWKRGVELGVYEGRTFFYLLDSCPDLKMVGVDLWEATPWPDVQDRETGHVSYARLPMAEIGERVFARALAYGTRATLHHCKTVDAAKFYQDKYFDFVFIDASHDTESVRADIQAWSPKVKPYGWLLGHDINWPSVQRAVDEEFHGMWRELPAHIWAMRRGAT